MSNLTTATVVIRRSKQGTIASILGGIAFGFLAILFFFQGESFAGVISFLATTVLLFTGVVGVKDRSPKIIIDDEGLTLADWEKIKWSDFESTRLVWWLGPTTIHIKYRNAEKKLLRFNVNGLELSPDKIYQTISAHINATKTKM